MLYDCYIVLCCLVGWQLPRDDLWCILACKRWNNPLYRWPDHATIHPLTLAIMFLCHLCCRTSVVSTRPGARGWTAVGLNPSKALPLTLVHIVLGKLIVLLTAINAGSAVTFVLQDLSGINTCWGQGLTAVGLTPTGALPEPCHILTTTPTE
jgi:hypothetical protein